MFKKVIEKAGKLKVGYQNWRDERANFEIEQAEESARIEREKIQKEKDLLMSLSEKELLVEVIMDLRGYNIRLSKIEEQQDELTNKVNSLESDVSSLENKASN
jgi:hypothetical protein